MPMFVIIINQNQPNKYKERLLLIGAVLFISAVFVSNTLPDAVALADAPKVSEGPHEVEVVLQRHYLDGEISEEEIEETIWSMEDFWSYYNDWDLVNLSEHQIVFKKHINDISPLLKMHGYFGVDEDGTLSIYNGKPQENEVIQSFFQINTKQLKSHIHESLMEGIPVSTRDEYMEVLKNCKKYAINGL
ncbi:BofC C-terminal domain-containing protein [Salipaludibacillus aurantiacus]|uniref:Forespore regulator of the sigma-K checkpoint n=1 Tax=Salipaludibacillus aurantiacus TaxID=1601833 RepID=A0A1H9RMH6_9BACI|nr:BofC C-terminal domain-containing protein [Salipaludibacillus aurantiacus]SER73293.1 forespore regulator of the sigma-K checkpoint [Salipaludibacillus aurantiacus]